MANIELFVQISNDSNLYLVEMWFWTYTHTWNSQVLPFPRDLVFTLSIELFPLKKHSYFLRCSRQFDGNCMMLITFHKDRSPYVFILNHTSRQIDVLKNIFKMLFLPIGIVHMGCMTSLNSLYSTWLKPNTHAFLSGPRIRTNKSLMWSPWTIIYPCNMTEYIQNLHPHIIGNGIFRETVMLLFQDVFIPIWCSRISRSHLHL